MADSSVQPGRGIGPGLVLAGRHLLMAVLGVLLGLYGALLVPAGPRLDGQLLSLGAGLAVVGNVAATRLAILGAGRYGGLSFLGGWLLAALLMSSRSPGGSVVLPGSGELATAALLYLLLGAAAGAIAAIYRADGRSRSGS